MAEAVMTRGTHQIEIFTTDEDGPGSRLDVPTDRPVMKGGVTIHYFRAHVGLKVWPCVSLDLWRALRRRISKFDIVHGHALYHFDSLISGHYCRKYGVPYLIRSAGTLDPYIFKRHRYRKLLLEWLYERRNLKHAAAVHFTTDEEMYLADQMIRFSKGVVVPLGLDIEKYDTLPEPGTFGQAFPEVVGKKIILFLGRINFKKGLDLLIPAFACLAKERDDIHLILAGPDNEGYGKKVRSWIQDEGVVGKVTFTGLLQGELKMAVLRDAEMFVLPSYSENFGIAVVEAMACGLPVVISNQVNIWRTVRTAGAGLVGECDASQIAEHMRVLLGDPDRAVKMGAKGKKLVEDRYSWPRVAEQLEEMYKTILVDAVNR